MIQLISDIKSRLSDVCQNVEMDGMVRILLSHYLNMSLPEVFLNPDRMPDAKKQAALWDAVDELRQHRPIQYVIGETEFYGLTFKLTSDVLIPRPETEELTDLIVQDARRMSQNTALKILDIGTGSGCIAVSLASTLPSSEVWAVDISQQALKVAEQNAAMNRVHVHFRYADILSEQDAFASGELFDIIASNPPYVTQQDRAEMQDNVLNYEPHSALFPEGDNPLVFYERIALFGKKHLQPEGRLYFEINESFPNETETILKRFQYQDIALKKDMRGKWRMATAKLTI
ncbi:MAG: peptide chain release factor N(5)-glutamine methyltransferase [Bacteroidales bacterium]|jgi:release factor glutamine methyltransferase|nr:peptide chain release factor N(5)-glutamine methyltransferase [Bacteroidales bacterium]